MSDGAAVALAVAVAVGCRSALPVAPVVAWSAVAVGLASRRFVVVCAAGWLLASALSFRAWTGLRPPPARTVRSAVTLLSDPHERFGAVAAVVRVDGRHVEAVARGEPAAVLGGLLAGDGVAVEGRLAPLSASRRDRLAVRHVVASLDVRSTGEVRRARGINGAANDLRRTLAGGAWPLPENQRALFAGFVLGDDRGQTDADRDAFRRSGLTHLLVVSGENVGFVLAVVAPVLAAFGLRGRLMGGLAVLVFFGVLTRWEPSVLRAEAMAALALLSVALARPVSTVRLLALAVGGLLLVDPLLAWSVGFGLSVGASAGIALFAARLADCLPGPRPVANAMAVTASAQLGVAPLLIPLFGPMPVAALPANLLAAPAAGALMAWGLGAGLVAGIAGGNVARVAHVPTHLLIEWISGVARAGSSAPLGSLGAMPLAAGAVAVTVVLLAPRR